MSMREIIETMARHEETIARLYETYAAKFQEMADFWKSLAIQELNHAGWLKALAEEVGQGKVHFKENRFKLEPLMMSVEYLEQELKTAQEEPLSLNEALARSFQIEQGMIEKKQFEVFETDSVNIKHVLQNLAEETGKHVSLIQEKRASIG